MTRRRVQLVEVVQHEHERARGGRERRRQPWRGAAQHRDAPHVGHQVGSPGEICAYADANTGSSAAGSSSKRSSDTHATGRSSVAAHSASRVDLP